MPRKGENIFKRKDKRWEGRYIKGRSTQGRAVYGYVYARSYTDVKKKLCNAIAAQCNGDEKHSILTDNPLFCDLSLNWLNSVQPQVKDSTYNKYHNLIQTYIIPEFREVAVSAMTEDAISEHCNHLLAYGGVQESGLSGKTVTDVISVVRRVLNYAQRKGVFVASTGQGISVKQTAKELSILKQNERLSLSHYLLENLSFQNLGLLICLMMGLRLGEICALRWEDISLQDEMLYVHHTMQRIQLEGDKDKKTAVVITTPKSTCSIRAIPIPENILNIMREHFSSHQGFVLTGSEKYIEPRSMENYFKRVQIKINICPVNFHVLRHTFATQCVEVGFDVKTLSVILGHANVKITMDRYVHPTKEMKQKNMNRLSDAFLVE